MNEEWGARKERERDGGSVHLMLHFNGDRMEGNSRRFRSQTFNYPCTPSQLLSYYSLTTPSPPPPLHSLPNNQAQNEFIGPMGKEQFQLSWAANGFKYPLWRVICEINLFAFRVSKRHQNIPPADRSFLLWRLLVFTTLSLPVHDSSLLFVIMLIYYSG